MTKTLQVQRLFDNDDGTEEFEHHPVEDNLAWLVEAIRGTGVEPTVDNLLELVEGEPVLLGQIMFIIEDVP